MKTHRLFIVFSLFIFTYSGTAAVLAQKGLIVEQVEKIYEQEVLAELHPNDAIWQNPELRINTFLGTEPEKLDETARKITRLPAIEHVKLYIQDEMFRMDSESKAGKMTSILRNDLGMMYQIIWDRNLVIKMSKAELDNMRKDALEMTTQIQKNMPPNITKMLESLPEPQRTQALEAMKRSGQSLPGMMQERPKPTIANMHRSKDFPHFKNCSEFRVVDDDKHMAIWAFGGNAKIARRFHEFGKTFKNTVNLKNDDTDPHELLPENSFPVFQISYREHMMGNRMEFKTWQIDKMEAADIPVSTFEVYKNPKLKEGSMMDMMQLKRKP